MHRPRVLRFSDLRKKIRRPAPRKADRRFKPPLRISQILKWADEYHARTGEWPRKHSGEVRGELFLTWYAIEKALNGGGRGLPAGLSIVKLLWKHRQVRSKTRPPPLTIAQILDWIDRHHARTGCWPDIRAGRVHEAPWENWKQIDLSMSMGRRGLPVGGSLARLLYHDRGVRNENRPPPLTVAQTTIAPVSGRTQSPDRSSALRARTGCWSATHCMREFAAFDRARCRGCCICVVAHACSGRRPSFLFAGSCAGRMIIIAERAHGRT
jgi:hypothetical protein